MANPVRSSEHIESARILSTLSNTPVNFGREWQFTPDEDQDAYETDEDETVAAAEILHNMRYGLTRVGQRHQSYDDTDTEMENSGTESNTTNDVDPLLSPPLTMFADIASGKPWFHQFLRLKPLCSFVEHSLRGPVTGDEAERRLEPVLAVMSERSCIQEACWYLEACGWDHNNAIALYRHDERQRRSRRLELHKRSTQVAKPVAQFNSLLLLKFHYAEAGAANRTVATLSMARDFDRDNDDHMRALNQWRNDMARLFVGPPKLSDNKPFPATLATYSEFEGRFLRNGFGSKIPEFGNKRVKTAFQEITDEFNKVFVGRFLPKAYSPCGPREWTSIKEHILTKLLGRKRDDPKYEKAAAQLQKIQEKERRDFDKLMGSQDGHEEEEVMNGSETANDSMGEESTDDADNHMDEGVPSGEDKPFKQPRKRERQEEADVEMNERDTDASSALSWHDDMEE